MSDNTCPYCYREWGSLQRMPPWFTRGGGRTWDNIPDPVDYGPTHDTVQLDRQRYRFQQQIGDLYPYIEKHSDFEYIKREMIMRLTYEVYSQQLDHVEVVYPATWWQHFKQWLFTQWAPNHWPWFADFGPVRWPVRTKKVVMDAVALYPKVAASDQAHCVRVFQR